MKQKGVAISVINPGFVATPLTAQNDFEMPFLMQPDEAARRTIAGLAAGRFEVAYPRRFVAILKSLRLLPYPLFFRLITRSVLKAQVRLSGKQLPHRVLPAGIFRSRSAAFIFGVKRLPRFQVLANSRQASAASPAFSPAR